jgi:hypothetical protein
MPLETPGTTPATTADDEAAPTRSRACPTRPDEALETLQNHGIELLLCQYDHKLGEESSVLLLLVHSASGVLLSVGGCQ